MSVLNVRGAAASVVAALQTVVTGHTSTLATQATQISANTTAATAAQTAAVAAQATVAKQTTDTGFDIIVLAGQSNMSGQGSAYDTVYLDPPDPRLFQWAFSGTYANVVSQAIEPLQHPDTSTPKMGPGIPFARWYEMQLPTNRKILLVPTAYGGTTFEGLDSVGGTKNWKISSTGQYALYPQSIAQARAALAASPAGSRIVAVLWLQGEQDSANSTSATTYAADLDALIAQYRTDLGNPTLPFVLGQMTYDHRIPATYPTYAAIDTVHQATPIRNQYCAMAYSPHVLGVQVTGFTDPTGGIIHYSAAGQRIMGRGFYDAYLQALNNVTGVAPVPPGAITLSQSSATQLAVDWIRPAGRATNYKVEYSTNSGSTWTTFTRTAGGQPWQLLTGLSTSATVSVRVSTINEQGTSSPTLSTPFTLAPPVLPSTPAITAAAGSTGSIVISGSSANATSFNIFRGTAAGSESGTAIATGQTLPFTDTGLTQGTTYFYYVIGVNGNGSSGQSNEVSSVPGVGFVDNFNRANATTTGNGWATPTSQTATFPIISNQLGIAGTSPTAAGNYLDFAPYAGTAGSMYAAMQVAAIGPGSANFPGVVICADSRTAPSTYYLAQYNVTASQWVIYKTSGATDTSVATSTGTTTAPTLPVQVNLAISGGVVTLSVAGTAVCSYTDPTPLTGVNVGVRFRAGGTSQSAATATEVMRVDNFVTI